MESTLINDYVATGDVYFEYRDFAFLGDESIDAAHAARCANDQDLFWEYHDALFFNQVQEGGHDNGQFARERLDRIAELVGLDMEAFDTCMSNDEYKNAVQEETASGAANQVGATPTFLINGEPVASARYSDIQPVIEEKLQATP